MRIGSPVPRKKSRIEIIPLIDIMFFLLASFMMVSLQMQKIRTIRASLPTATLAKTTEKPDLVTVKVSSLGRVSVDNRELTFPELYTLLTNRFAANTNLPVYITGQKDTTHGSMIYVLDFVKRAGIAKVAVSVKPDDLGR